MKRIIITDGAPGAIGPYSQAVETGNLLFCSGQIPLDPKTGKLVEGGIEEQAEQVLKNVKGLLEGAGYTLLDVCKATIFARSMNDFAIVNEIYGKYFSHDSPARSFVEVSGLPRGALVEIEVVACK
jgi:2-iminobutanoate/2-iminopropanoate deaminase